MPRSSWKGHIRLSLVTIPVKAYTANAAGKEIHLNQLHDECKSRIRYQKTCPQHGEVGNDEIVMGYEFAKDQYVVVDAEELEDLRTESDRAINIDAFAHPQDIDQLHFSGKSYFLTPDGPIGQKPYALLLRAMQDDGLCCVAQVVMHGREQLVLLRPLEKLICMSILAYEDQVRKPAEFEDEVGQANFSPVELDLTKKLIEATTAEEFNLGKYENVYYEKLKQLIEAKIEGRQIVAPPDEQPQQVINLMDALKASVAQAQETAADKGKTPKKVAASARKRKAAARGKKTG
jgi:DNA end-binding protein Ku